MDNPFVDKDEVSFDMLKFRYKLKVNETVAAKCPRHTRYNPEIDGRGGIRGACSACFDIYELYQARLKLEAAAREFSQRAAPWIKPKKQRSKHTTAGSSEGSTES